MATSTQFLPAASHIPTRSLFVARDGAYSVSGGGRVDLSTKRPLRRILRAIVQAHRDQPRRTLSEVLVRTDAGYQLDPWALVLEESPLRVAS